MTNKKRIAIIGSGISGLSCAYLLQNEAEVSIFEAEHRLGGHCHTHKVNDMLGIDMGFIVFNSHNYPNLLALFEEIGADYETSNMSFGVSAKRMDFEYSSLNVLAQKRNLIRPKFYKMMLDVLRFYKEAPNENLSQIKNISLGEYLVRKKYCKEFIDLHLLPQASAIWSSSVEEILDYPFAAFLNFFNNHGLFELDMKKRIEWQTVKGGSINYVERLKRKISANFNLNSPIVSVARTNDGIEIFDAFGNFHKFDEVVLATHADISSSILKTQTNTEKEILPKMQYTKNRVILHTDTIAMPKRRKSWASWNYLLDTRSQEKASVTYWMNLLQNIKSKTNYFVTLNPFYEIEHAKIISERIFEHPKFDKDAIWAQNEFHKIQGKDRIWFCGAYLGYGFHEDGAQSGLWVAEKITGQKRPWPFDLAQSRLPKSFNNWHK